MSPLRTRVKSTQNLKGPLQFLVLSKKTTSSRFTWYEDLRVEEKMQCHIPGNKERNFE